MKDEALDLALEALESCDQVYGSEGSYQYFSQAKVDKAITAIKQALAAPVQEPVAWLTEERYAEIHTSKWSPKIKQVFSKEGILESQTIQYAPQSKAIPYPPAAQRQWVGLTDEDIYPLLHHEPRHDLEMIEFIRIVEAKLKEKNT
jgi:hypothetical protein